MTDHDRIRALLPEVANGSASQAGRTAVNAHVAECAVCAADLDAWRAIATVVPAAPEAEPSAGVPSAVWDRIDAEDAAGASVPLQPRRPRVWPRVARTGAAAAAVLVLIVVSSPQWRGTDHGPALVLAAARLESVATVRADITGRGVLQPAGSDAADLRVPLQVTGHSEWVIGEASHVVLEVSAGGLLDASERMESIAIGHQEWQRVGEGPWEQADSQDRPEGLPLIRHVASPEELLRAADGPVKDLGTRDQADGTKVQGYEFDLDRTARVADGDAYQYRAQVWIGVEDGLLRQARVYLVGEITEVIPFRMLMLLDIVLRDFGAPLTITPPPLDAEPVSGEPAR